MRALSRIFAGKLRKGNVDLGPVRVCFRYVRFYPGFLDGLANNGDSIYITGSSWAGTR